MIDHILSRFTVPKDQVADYVNRSREPQASAAPSSMAAEGGS
jgi:hypothetical protein